MPTHHERLMVIGNKMTDILTAMFHDVAEEAGGKLAIDRDIEYHDGDINEERPSFGIVTLVGNVKDENKEDDKVFTLRVISHNIPDEGYTHLIVRNLITNNDEATYQHALRLVNEMNSDVQVSQCLLQSNDPDETSDEPLTYAIGIHTAIDDEIPDAALDQVLEMYLIETLTGLHAISLFNHQMMN